MTGSKDDVLSTIDALLSGAVPSSSVSSASTTTKASLLSDTISQRTPKSTKHPWTNRCALCNGLPAARHSSTTCCLVCRNYSYIDRVAERWKVEKLLSLQVSGKTFRAVLESEDDKLQDLKKLEAKLYRELKHQRAIVELLLSPRNEALIAARKARDKYNAIMKADKFVSLQSTSAKKAYNRAKAKFDSLDSVFRAEEVGFQNATKDHLSNRHALEEQESLLLSILDKITHRLLHLARIPDSDTVGRARLFFSWVSKSLRYDTSAHDRLSAEQRIPFRTILNSYEVCHGFANLFNTMFNAGCKSEDEKRSIYISGHTKQYFSQRATDENAHAWNAFPLSEGGWKIIDCTWASGAVNNANSAVHKFDPDWFVKSNEGFLRTHIPDSFEHRFRSNKSPPLENKGLWCTQSVEVLPYSNSSLIDYSSIKPASRVIDTAPNTRTVFKLKKSCAHYDGAEPAFVIWAGRAPKERTAKTIDADDLMLLPKLLDASGWRASVKLPAEANMAALFMLVSDGRPAQLMTLEEWSSLDTKKSYEMIVRWKLEGAG